jgi:hypothetical protein
MLDKEEFEHLKVNHSLNLIDQKQELTQTQ